MDIFLRENHRGSKCCFGRAKETPSYNTADFIKSRSGIQSDAAHLTKTKKDELVRHNYYLRKP